MDEEKTPTDSIKDPKEEDPFAFLKIVQNPDGSLTRSITIPLSPPDSSSFASVLSKDLTLNPTRNTWIRIFRPRHPPNPTLPVLIYFHGGGFIFFSAASEPFHGSCKRMALELPAIVISVEYRLAPEHPLPAAYDDAIDAVRWVRDDARRDPWFDSADLLRCFLMGSSAGGNIVYHAALQAIDLQTPDFKIAGLILNQPYFGGEQRTESELKLVRDRILPLHANDLMWRLSLPAGANRDHVFCNPMVSGALVERAGLLPRCSVTGHGLDPLVDRQRQLARMLEELGVHVASSFDEDGFHGVELFDPRKAEELLGHTKDFIYPQTVTVTSQL